jgi:hypothetical protein
MFLECCINPYRSFGLSDRFMPCLGGERCGISFFFPVPARASGLIVSNFVRLCRSVFVGLRSLCSKGDPLWV